MATRLKLRVLFVNDRRTSVKLEPELWRHLDELARQQRTTVGAIVSRIDRERGTAQLTSALRVYVVNTPLLLPEAKDSSGSIVPTLAGPGTTGAHPWSKHLLQRSFDESFTRDLRDLRETYSLDALAGYPDHIYSEILAFADAEKAATGSWPSIARFREVVFGHHQVSARNFFYNVIDVAPENPAYFSFSDVSEYTSLSAGKDLSATRLGQYPYPLIGAGLQMDFNQVKAHPEPRLQIIEQRIDGRFRHYARLLFPTRSEGAEVAIASFVVPFTDSFIARKFEAEEAATAVKRLPRR